MNRTKCNHQSRANHIPQRVIEANAPSVSKVTAVIGLIVSILATFPSLASAQIVSNLGEVANAGSSVTSTAWTANRFTTGNNAGGYTLDSVTGLFNGQTTAGTFVAQIYSDSGDRPGSSLESLTGDAPETFGQHTFTSTGLSLDANTSYWVAWTPTSGHYNYNLTFSNNESSTDGWTIGSRSASSDAGTNWSAEGPSSANLFSIQATPVPEPHEYAMFVGLGLIGFVALRRRFQMNSVADTLAR